MTRATRLRGRPAVPARLRTVDLHLRLTPEQRAALATEAARLNVAAAKRGGWAVRDALAAEGEPWRAHLVGAYAPRTTGGRRVFSVRVDRATDARFRRLARTAKVPHADLARAALVAGLAIFPVHLREVAR